MGIEVKFPHVGNYVELTQYVRGYAGGVTPSYSRPTPFGYWDPLGTLAAGSRVHFGTFNVEDVVGHYRPTYPDSVRILDSKPFTRPYDQARDYHRYYGFMPALQATAKVLRGERVYQDVPSKERDTYHATPRGTVVPALLDVPGFYDYQPTYTLSSNVQPRIYGAIWGGTGIQYRTAVKPTNNVSTTRYYRILSTRVGGVQTYSSPTNEATWAYLGFLLSDIGDAMYTGKYAYAGTSKTYTSQIILGRVGSLTIKVLSVDRPVVRDDLCRVGATFQMYDTLGSNGIGSTSWHTSVCVRVLGLREDRNFPPSSATYIVPALSYEEAWTCDVISATRPSSVSSYVGATVEPGLHTEVSNFTHPDRVTPAQVASNVMVNQSASSLINLDTAIKRLRFRTFEDRVLADFGSIQASAFQSTSEAMSELELSLGTNLIEQLSQLQGISDYLPRLHEALLVVRSLTKRDIPGTIRGVLDLVTELRLRASFSYAPDLDFITNTLPIIGEVASKLSLHGTETVVARGIFEYDFPEGTFGRMESSLKTCTKIVAVRDNDSVLAHILGVNDLGLFPGPANFWDLVPMSFVLDWFFGIRERIADIESSLFLAALGPSYLVHSYLVRTPYTLDELRSCGLAPYSEAGMSAPHFRVYTRHISRWIPSPREGKFDFRLPSSGPNLFTSGSLAWQVLT